MTTTYTPTGLDLPVAEYVLPQDVTDLVVVETLNALTVFAPGGVEDVLARLEKQARAAATDASTPANRKHLTSLAYKVARSKTALDKLGKDLAADAYAQWKSVTAEREARIAAEAAATAQAAAKAKADAAEIAARVERDRLAAEQRAERSRQDAIEAERRRVATEQATTAREAEKRAANLAHQRKIHRDILAALALLDLTEDQAKAVITAIARGDVPHVSITY